jgi:PKD repeat protein
MRKYFFFLFFLTLTGTALAQDKTTAQTKQALQILSDRGEIVFKFTVASKTQINQDLTNIISIDHVKTLPGGQGFEVRAYANTQEFQEFLTRNIPYEIIPKIQTKALTMATTVAAMTNWDAYPTYSVYEQMMANFAASHPAICKIDTIFSSTPSGNYRILAARISDNVNISENEPHFLYTSSIHGDETTGFILMLRLINYLLTNYGTLPKVTNLVNNTEIWICPLSNPEGTYYQSSPAGSTIANSRRENLAGVDMNRNYPDPRAGQNPDGNSWQPETQAFMTFAENHHFNMSANFHGGAEITNYPWDTWITTGNPNADSAWWERVCTAYVDSARLVTPTYFSDVVADGVSEGGDWYVITGGRQDYMNFYQHCREVTIELDVTKTTPTENLNLKWNENYHSLLNYIQESNYGVRGIITDSCSGQPIRAKVWVNGYDQTNDSSQVYSALPVGNYHKYMIAGTYNITYSAPGYTSKTISGVTLANGAATIRNIQLAPAASPDSQFTGTLTNPCSGTVIFTNTTASATTFFWDFGDGNTSTLMSPSHTYLANGTYTVKLIAGNCKGVDSLIRTNYITVTMISAPVVTNGAHCGTGNVSLSATGTGTINWFDSASGGNLLYTGTNFTTPSISSTTTYYAANDETPAPISAGMVFVNSGGGGTSSGQHYLLFDAYVPFTLLSVKVNNTSTSSLSKTIQLQDASGNIISGQQTTVSVPAGTSVVNLNFSVPVGTNHRLVCTDGINFYRHNSGVNFPYNSGSILSITGSDAGSAYYYYFYEWQVQGTGCISSLVPVTASILSVPVAAFSSSVNSNTVDFTNTTNGATSYEWDFGDGGNSTQFSPSYTYTANGTYTVQLISSNGGCSDTISHDVTITTVGGIGNNTFAGVSVYPNPAQDNLIVSFGSVVKKSFTLEIFSLSGAIIYKNSYHSTSEPLTLKLSSITEGIYNLVIRDDTDQMHFKVVKIK